MSQSKRRADLLLSVPDSFFFEDIFEKKGKEIEEQEVVLDMSKTTSDMMYCSPLLNKNQEFILFRKFNYFRYKAFAAVAGKNWRGLLRSKPAAVHPLRKTENKSEFKNELRKKIGKMSLEKISRVESLICKAIEVRNIIVKSNIRLAVRPISRHEKNISSQNWEELISTSCFYIIRAADKFDYLRGFRFSTYCVNVLVNNLKRDLISETTKKSKFWCEMEESNFEEKREIRISQYDRAFLEKALGLLGEDEKQIVLRFFGVEEKASLKEMAAELGISRTTILKMKTKALKAMSLVEYDPI